MRVTDLKQEMMKMRFKEIYCGWDSGRLSQEEAAEVLGVSSRTFRRKLVRYEEFGMEWLLDLRLQKRVVHRTSVDEVEKVIRLYKESYRDWSIRHFYDHAREKYKFKRSYNWVRLTLQSKGLVHPVAGRGKHRRKRERKPMIGMMLHQDGSRHEWIEGRYDDLIVTMDDATNEIYSMFLTEEEGTISTMRGITEVIERRGLFGSLYSDRGSHYAVTRKAGEKVEESGTQVQRALSQLGISMIHAYSPQARGRSERMFGTLQGRLPQELKLEGITTMEAANRYIQNHFLPEFNHRFRMKPREKESAFVPYIGRPLDDILCLQEERVVRNDNTVSYNGKILQIPADDKRYHYVKCKVTVAEHLDRNISILYGPRKLSRYDHNGNLANLEATMKKAA